MRFPSSSDSRRRYHVPSPSKFVKYALFVTFALLTVTLWQRRTLTKYLPGSQQSIGAQDTALHGKVEELGEYRDDDSLPAAPVEDLQDVHPAQDLQVAPATPNNPSQPIYPRFGKITATFGEPDPPYESAIASHNLHNEIHGYPHFILRQQMLRGLWSKHAWIMTIIAQELSKPEEQRLEWVMWHDRDTVLMNPQLPLDIFVPPPKFSRIHMLVTDDKNGLNNGVFLCRVSQLAFKFFASSLSIREYQPEIPLKYTEQSGMEEVIKREGWDNAVAYVPQRWFNGFPPKGKKSSPSSARPGSLLIHFASNRDGLRPQRMAEWGEIAKNRTPEWDKPVQQTNYVEEIAEYWDRLGNGESQESIIGDIAPRIWD